MKANGNKPFKPFLILLYTSLLLFLWAMVDVEVIPKSLQLKHLALFSEIEKTKVVPVFPKPEMAINFPSLFNDSISAQFLNKVVDSISSNDYQSQRVNGLAHFFENLKTKKKIRIAWFGDSMVEGDLITQDLRYLLQRKYGGAGVGIVPITSNTAGFRQTVRHTFSDNWQQKSILDNTFVNGFPGITGHVFMPQVYQQNDTLNTSTNNYSWVNFKGCNRRGLDKFYNARLYYGKSDKENQVSISINNGKQRLVKLTGEKAVNVFDVEEKDPFSEIKFTFINQSNLPVYAVSLESDSGVVVDNLSFRGNSGMPLTKIPYDVLNGFNEINEYDLIILQYGMNAVSSTNTDYSWYKRGLSRMVKHIMLSFPNTSILFVGVPDKGYNQDGTYITDPGVPFVVEAEKQMAQENGIAFWNLFDAMGGYNSMVKWANADTSLANKDYTHFNFRGASKVAKLLYNQIDKEYNAYLKAASVHKSESIN